METRELLEELRQTMKDRHDCAFRRAGEQRDDEAGKLDRQYWLGRAAAYGDVHNLIVNELGRMRCD